VLMDVQMPQMDGHEATRRLRALPAHARLPVIAMTAHASARDRALCLEAGMDDVVTKPIDPGTLFAALARRLGPPAAPVRDGAAAAPVAPAGMSIAQGLRRCMGRTDLYRRVAQRYLQQWTAQRRALRAAAATGDARAMAETAHALIAGAGTVGADALAELARQLQEQAEAGAHPRWPELLDRVEREGATAEAALTAYLANDASSAPAG
jgi:two-component system sensor histidine kinase/response regulator